jgi:peptidyl-prolyl cis-trans isomerase B (cyclophilin B)
MSISKRHFFQAILLSVLLSSLFSLSCSRLRAAGPLAEIETDFGVIKIKLLPDLAPQHVKNFAKLAREGFYDGLAFHRLLPGLIIQGGDPQTRNGDRSQWGMGEPGQPTVPAEFSSRPFERGTVGMARRSDINSATSQFFICLRENPRWNGQYTVFGEVVEGIDVVDRISREPTEPGQNGKARDKILMKKVTVTGYDPAPSESTRP